MIMTEIFCYGTLNLTKIFGVTKETDVREELRPFLFQRDNNGIPGDFYLNVTFTNKKEISRYGHTHTLTASRKGVANSWTLTDLKEYMKPQQQPVYQQQPQYLHPQQQSQPQPQSQHQDSFDGGGYGVDF